MVKVADILKSNIYPFMSLKKWCGVYEASESS